MRQTLQLILYVAVAIVLTAGCTGKRSQAARESDRQPQPADTLYTAEKALMVYDYQPGRALQIIDSAVIVGNMSDWWADKHRARIYSQTRAGSRLDSLMHWTDGTRFDTARAIGERLLRHDSIRNSLKGQQDVLEMLAYVARKQYDTTLWLQHSRQLVDVCRRQGAETEALRNEAEIGTAMWHAGRQDEGMAKLDSVIAILSAKQPFKFNELDALVIALRRKISALATHGRQAAYRVLRTLLYEYCRRRYDSSLSGEGVWTADSPVDDEERTDPATMPRPEPDDQQPAPGFPKALDISEAPIAPVADRHETVHIVADEAQMMAAVRSCHGTPAVWLSLLLSKAVARLHPADGDGVPTVVVTVNLRKALGTPLSHHALVGGLSLPYTKELQSLDIEGQMAAMRQMVVQQTTPDRLQAYFWQTADRMDLLEQMPAIEARRQAMSQVAVVSRQYGSTTLSYVGRACMGGAERYVRELRTESSAPYPISLQVAAVSGKFCLSFMQQFSTDACLDAFLGELQEQGITWEITGRHPMEIASIADYRES